MSERLLRPPASRFDLECLLHFLKFNTEGRFGDSDNYLGRISGGL